MDRLDVRQFGELARQLASLVSSHNLESPSFRTPPRDSSLTRSIRRRTDGTRVVSVAIRDRTRSEVLQDMVEGVLVTNDLTDIAAAGWRLGLMATLDGHSSGLDLSRIPAA